MVLGFNNKAFIQSNMLLYIHVIFKEPWETVSAGKRVRVRGPHSDMGHMIREVIIFFGWHLFYCETRRLGKDLLTNWMDG